MLLRSRVAILSGLFFVVLGCSGLSADEKQIVGDWKGQFIADKGKPIQGANMTFDKEHRFRELYRNLEVKGSWKLSGKTLTLQPDTIGGTSISEARKRVLVQGKNDKAVLAMAASLDKPIPLKVSPDGKALTTERDEAARGYAIYTKQ
jgi:hypothetical protein